MPLDTGTTETQTQAHDIGPGNQAVAGAAQCCMCGKKGLYTEEDGGPECELFDGRWVCSSDCYDVALGIMLKPVAEAAAIRKAALREVLALPRYTPPQTWTSGVPFKEAIWVANILALIDNTGEETE